METRKIMVANTKTQTRSEIMTDAVTLGQLKAALDEAQIDYSDMDFTEGISKTVLISDDSLLPTNVMFKGHPTNDLIILLTNTSKKVASGCTEGRSRKDAYAIINEQGDEFKEAIKREFGANYTLITTENLWLFIDEHLENDNDDYDDDEEEEDDFEEDANTTPSEEITFALRHLIKLLAYSDLISYKDLELLGKIISDYAEAKKAREEKHYSIGNTTISDSDIDDMISSI